MISFFADGRFVRQDRSPHGSSGALEMALAEAFARQSSRVGIGRAIPRDCLTRRSPWTARGIRVPALPCDVSRREQVGALAQNIRSRCGEVQILVDSGRIARGVNFIDIPAELRDEAIRANKTGARTTAANFFAVHAARRMGPDHQHRTGEGMTAGCELAQAH